MKCDGSFTLRTCCAAVLFCWTVGSGGLARADLMGGFVAPPPAPLFVPLGGAAVFGPPFTSPLSTTLTTSPLPGPGIPLPPPTPATPALEVLFLTDTTGSMSLLGNGGIDQFKSAISGGGGLLTAIEGLFPGVGFTWAVADYHDVIGASPYPGPQYAIQASFGTALSAQAAIAAYDPSPSITTGGGLPGQEPEQQFSSLVELTSVWETLLGGSGLGVAERMIVWTGDSPANEGVIIYPGPVTGVYPTTFSTFSALREQSIAVYGLNMGPAMGGIDTPGSLAIPQASQIAEATGGIVYHGQSGAGGPAMATDIISAVTSALTTMNNITVRVDPSTLGLWDVTSIERTTAFPFDPFYPFNFTYTGLAPAGDPSNPFGFPRPWGTDPPLGYADTWGFTVIAPSVPDTQVVTFEMRVDGVLIGTTDVTLTNLPEPSTLVLGIFGLVPLVYCGWRRRAKRPCATPSATG